MAKHKAKRFSDGVCQKRTDSDGISRKRLFYCRILMHDMCQARNEAPQFCVPEQSVIGGDDCSPRSAFQKSLFKY